ncbi:MAG TPA: hypothetical protein VGS20_07000 [Candidatus Acidoferrales bacterium]|nr:hypothetical protein [Candidatus Acidoferrales bacterium]
MTAACAITVIGFSAPASAQSPGSFGGAFSKGFIVPTIVCAIGTTTLTSGGVPVCSPTNSTQTGSKSNTAVYGPALVSSIKIPSGSSDKDILLMASLETTIVTDTLVTSNGGSKSTSSAAGAIVVTPAVCSVADPCPAGPSELPIWPDHVTFQSQVQTLSALLGQACFNSLGTAVCGTAESIELLLSIGGAHSFNFLVDTSNATSGVYDVQLGITVTQSASTNTIGAGASVGVAIGAGSLGELVVKTETPFDTIRLCDQNTTSSPALCASGGTIVN